jgi:acyl-CoA hydrolase
MVATHPSMSKIRKPFDSPAGEDSVLRTLAALEARGFVVARAHDAAQARQIVLDLIPKGSEVSHGVSKTLQDTGILDALDGRFDYLAPRLRQMDRTTHGDEIRRLMMTPGVMLGSVHAVTEDGTLLAGSSSGSQLAAYAAGAGRVILVVGTQKIVADEQEGLRRIEEHSLPLEDARARAVYGMPGMLNKILVIRGELFPGRITVVVVDEVLGF